MNRQDERAACDGCPLIGRRDFLRDATLSAAGLLAALGADPTAVMAQRATVAPLSRVGEEVTYGIPSADGTEIDRRSGTMVTRWQGKVYVHSLACPHQNTGLRWYQKDGRFECPKHHSRFAPDGEYVEDSGRATRGLDRFAVRRDDANVVANLEQLYRQDHETAEWSAAFVAV
jgi:nitrite reductase/ring-hydroxylating ferredoxin subunit